MSIEFTPWPVAFTKRYREKGYWTDLPLTDILQRQFERRPESVAIICGDREITYAQLDRMSSNLAEALTRRGLQTHDKALVQLPNVAEFYIVFFALMKIGVAPVNAIYSHQKTEMTSYAEQLEPELIIGCAKHSLFKDGIFLSELQEKYASIKTVMVLGDTEYAESLNDLIHNDRIVQHKYSNTSPDKVAFFQLSGGSTGTPKLIPRTHNDYYYSIRRSAIVCQVEQSTKFLCALPVAHNFSLSSPGGLGVFYAGGTVVLAESPEAIKCFHLIKQHKVNMAALVPPAVSLWIKALDGHNDKLASLELLQVGGASFSESVAKQVPEKLGCQLQQVFGMAEGLVNYTRLNDPYNLVMTTQGRPMCPDDELKVVDQDWQEVEPGEVGMLMTRGPYTIRGYYKADEHNCESFDSGGFYATGDLVQLTEEGYIQVVGRVKDQINRGGEKIASEEIEKLLMQHIDVIHAALISVPDDIMGEKSCAYIVSHNEKIKPITLRKFLRQKGIADYKLPDKFEFKKQLPLTPIGKIDKKELRNSFL